MKERQSEVCKRWSCLLFGFLPPSHTVNCLLTILRDQQHMNETGFRFVSQFSTRTVVHESELSDHTFDLKDES